jgi:hypothetical protein
MSKKLQITLDEKATQKYLEWASAKLTAEVDGDCEPCGCSITIDIGGPYGSSVFGHTGDGRLDLGEAEVDLV